MSEQEKILKYPFLKGVLERTTQVTISLIHSSLQKANIAFKIIDFLWEMIAYLVTNYTNRKRVYSKLRSQINQSNSMQLLTSSFQRQESAQSS